MSEIEKIDFGRVSKYVDDKGFGFVSQSIHSQSGGDVFFHIKAIKNSQGDIAKKIENGGYVEDSECENNIESTDAICFWYRAEKTNKGLQVKSVIHINNLSQNEIDHLRNKIEQIWQNQKYVSNCLIHATESLLGADRTNELRKEKNDCQIKETKEYLNRLKEDAASRNEGAEPIILMNDQILKVEIDSTIQKIRELDGSERKHLELIETEYKQIIEEMKPLGFTHSKELSDYIIKNKRGKKYKNISGIVKMEKDGDSWSFNGGFPKKVYTRICEDLNLENEGSNAKVIGFKFYSDLNDD